MLPREDGEKVYVKTVVRYRLLHVQILLDAECYLNRGDRRVRKKCVQQLTILIIEEMDPVRSYSLGSWVTGCFDSLTTSHSNEERNRHNMRYKYVPL